MAGVVAALVARHDVEILESRSTILPLPSSPHWAPKMMILLDKLFILAHCVTLAFMQLSDVFLNLGEDRFSQLLRGISIGKLRTYQLFERLKFRFHLVKLNTETAKSGSAILGAADRAR